MSGITHQPTWTGTTLTLSAVKFTILTLGLTTPAVVVGGLAATATLAVGLVHGSRCIVDAADGLFLLSLLPVNASGVGTEALLLAAAGSILAWDLTDDTRSVGTHLGRKTDTLRLELVHAAATLVMLAVDVTVAYGADQAAAGGQPITAIVLLLVGVAVFVAIMARWAVSAPRLTFPVLLQHQYGHLTEHVVDDVRFPHAFDPHVQRQDEAVSGYGLRGVLYAVGRDKPVILGNGTGADRLK